MQAATLSQLDLLERIVFEMGLRGEAAGKELERRLSQPTAPLYVHRPERFLRFYQKMYEETFERHGLENAPKFSDWMSEAELNLCGLKKNYSGELIPV